MFNVRNLFLLLCLCLTYSAVLALDPLRNPNQYVRKTWTPEHGLPQSSVTTIIQDRKGYLWLGTFGGLARFDGVHFEVFRTATHPELRSDRILSLFEDRSGKIWIGTEGSGVTTYENGRFQTFTASDNLPIGLVHEFRQDRSGTVWIASDCGLIQVTGHGSRRYTHEHGLPVDEVTSVFIMENGNLLLGTHEGLWKKTANNFSEVDRSLYGTTSIFFFHESKNGLIWTGGEAGLFCITNGIGKRVKPGKMNQLGSSMEDRDGNLWLTSARLQRLSFSDHELKLEELALPTPRVVFEDREGSLWVGTNTEGLIQFRNGRVISHPLLEPPQSTLSILQDPKGGIWAGVSAMGIVHFDGAESILYGKDSGLSSLYIWSLLLDHSGQLWAGSYGDGIYRKEGETFIQIEDSKHRVKAMLETQKGQLLAGTETGLYTFDRSGLHSTPVEGTGNLHIMHISEDPHGVLWLGTTAGLRIMHPEKMVSLTKRDGLSSNLLRCIHLNNDGTAWLATYGGGLNYFDGKTVIRIGLSEGLPDESLSFVMEDSSRNIWVTSNSGIFRIDRSSLDGFIAGTRTHIDATHFNEIHGMLNRECNGGGQPSGFQDSQGNLWVPTMEGIAVVPTELKHESPNQPRVHIEGIFIDGSKVDPKDGLLTLPPGSRNMEIHFTSLTFINPDKTLFNYKLEGFDKKTIHSETRRVAYYPYVPPGDFRFTVSAVSSEGVSSINSDHLRIELKPMIHQAWWFWILVSVILIFPGYKLNSHRIKRLERQKQHISELVANKTAELEQLVDLTRKVNEGLLLEEVLDVLFESFRNLLPYNRIGCALLTNNTVRAVWERNDQDNTKVLGGLTVPISKTSLGKILTSGKPRILNDLVQYHKDHPQSTVTRQIVNNGIRSSLTFPLIAAGRNVGFLFFSSRTSHTYADVHTHTFEQIAGTLSQIISKSSMYSELLHTREKLETANHELVRVANLDGLTGVANRRSFNFQINSEWRRAMRNKSSLSLLMIDIDHFKNFNDEYGHQCGDICLQNVASTLHGALRRVGDFLARYGGEEFVVILPNSTAKDCALVAETLRYEIENMDCSRFGSIDMGPVTVSIGGACRIPHKAISHQDLLASADEALYRAKDSGRNRFILG